MLDITSTRLGYKFQSCNFSPEVYTIKAILTCIQTQLVFQISILYIYLLYQCNKFSIPQFFAFGVGIGVPATSDLGWSYYRSHKNLVCTHYVFVSCFSSACRLFTLRLTLSFLHFKCRGDQGDIENFPRPYFNPPFITCIVFCEQTAACIIFSDYHK